MAIRIEQGTRWLGGILIAATLASGAISYVAMEQVRVGGHRFQLIANAKDLTADILPPPLYLVESQLAVQEIVADPAGALPEDGPKLARLHQDYLARVAFWKDMAPPAKIGEVLFGRSHQAAETFWGLVDNQLIPAARAGDVAALHKAGDQITAAYRTHRKAVDDMVPMLDAYTRQQVKASEDAVVLSRIILFLAGALTSLAVYLGVRTLSRRVVAPIKAISGYMSDLASGDFSRNPPFLDRQDEVGDMAASVEVFRKSAAQRQAQQVQQDAQREAVAAERAEHEARLQEQDQVRSRVINEIADALFLVAEGHLIVRLDNPFPPEYEKLRSDFNSAVIALQKLDEDKQANEQTLLAADQVRGEVVASLARSLSQVADGKLNVRLLTPFPIEYEQLRQDFNGAVAALDSLLANIASSTAAMDEGIMDIAASADDVATRTEQQSATLSETAAAFDELTATVGQTSQIAQEARTFVARAREGAGQSGGVVDQAVSAMSEIESSSKQITQIIGVIDEIAFQTNLLALNAGVEAARAGEAGRGFAVVASEVRALAQRSADAAKEIKTLIQASESQVSSGVSHVNATGKALTGIVEQVTRIDALIAEIASSAQQQAAALAQVNEAVNQMDQSTQQNVGMVEETKATSRAIRRKAEILRQQIQGFELSSSSSTFVDVKPEKPQAPAQRFATQGALALSPALSHVTDHWEEF